MDRRNARACAMKLVYEWIMGGNGGTDTLTGILEIKPDEKEADFMNGLYEGVKLNCSAIDAEISKRLSEKWSLERISKVNLAILRIAVYELLYTASAPSVVINEAVELANIYSEDRASAFINGVLGNMVRSMN